MPRCDGLTVTLYAGDVDETSCLAVGVDRGVKQHMHDEVVTRIGADESEVQRERLDNLEGPREKDVLMARSGPHILGTAALADRFRLEHLVGADQEALPSGRGVDATLDAACPRYPLARAFIEESPALFRVSS